MAGKARDRKTFGKKLKDQQDDNKTLFSLASQGTITQTGGSIIGGGSIGGSTYQQVAATDLYMNTYDIVDTDRLKFAVKEGAGDALTTSDYGIEAVYSSGSAYGMKFQIPATKSYYFNSGSGQMTFSDSLGLVTSEAITGGTLSTAGYVDFDNIQSPSNPSTNHVRLFADSDNSDHLTIRKSNGSEVDLESVSGGANTSLSNLSNVAVNTDIDMGTYDITNLCRLEFDPAGSTLANTTAGIDATADEMHFNVPVGDDFKFTVNGTEEFVFKSNELDVKDNDICNVGTIFTDYIAVSSGNSMIKSVGHFDPFGGDTYDLGDATNYWRHLYISGDIHFKDGDDAEIKKNATGLEYEVATGDYHRFQVNNVTKFQVGATSCSMDGGMIIGSADGVEIGYKVDNQALTVGSKGSMIHPYLASTTSQSTGSNSTLDGYFGDRDGAIGIQYDSSESAGSGKYRVWIRANGGWYRVEAY